MKPDAHLLAEAYKQGYWLNEPGDHILELMKNGKVIARFNQSRVTAENIMDVVNGLKPEYLRWVEDLKKVFIANGWSAKIVDTMDWSYECRKDFYEDGDSPEWAYEQEMDDAGR